MSLASGRGAVIAKSTIFGIICAAAFLTRVRPNHGRKAGNSSGLGLGLRKRSFTESPLLLSAPAHMRTRQRSLTESPIQKGTGSQKAHVHCCLSATTAATQPHRKLSASGTRQARQDSLAESSHENRQHSLTESPIQILPGPPCLEDNDRRRRCQAHAGMPRRL